SPGRLNPDHAQSARVADDRAMPAAPVGVGLGWADRGRVVLPALGAPLHSPPDPRASVRVARSECRVFPMPTFLMNVQIACAAAGQAGPCTVRSAAGRRSAQPALPPTPPHARPARRAARRSLEQGQQPPTSTMSLLPQPLSSSANIPA